MNYKSIPPHIHKKPEKNKPIIFFDLDGTLINVKDRYYEAHKDACIKAGIKTVNKNVYWKKKRGGIKESKIIKIHPNLFKKYEETRVSNLEKTEFLKLDIVIPGAPKVLNVLNKKGYEIYLLTLRRNKKNLLDQLSWLGLKHYFKKIVSVSPSNKPYEVKMRVVKKIIKNKKNPVYVIGDTEADILTGRELKASTVGVLTVIRNNDLLQSYKPDYIIKNIIFLLDITL